ncbi:hypothetical protein ACFRFH_03425 [Leifsonia sp. NPDC056824]|uniref:hypothetical protein n=1 Tax=Leifsonia sp. NPDC056824 TaxID=3345953 RepID=UPI00369C6460
MNHHSSYDRAHDDAQRLARRHERDLHWAKERRRQQEREIVAASALLASSPWALARRTILVTVSLLVAVAVAEGFATAAHLPAGWLLLADAVAVAVAVAVLICAAVALAGVRSRRAAARALVRSHDERLSHTQYHISESVHTFIDAHAEVVNTRPANVARNAAA